ncbi:hypothetical protein ACFL0H_02840 [Thermodesulfobacteriota bacterium]
MSSPLFTNEWIEQIVQRLALKNQSNRLEGFGGVQVFQEPIIGIADGDDPIFEVFLTAVSPNHLLPRDFMERNSPEGTDLTNISIISWALPFSEEVRDSNRNGKWPSPLYSLARNNGGTLIHEVTRNIIEILRDHGKTALAPVLTEEYDTFRSEKYTFTSSWSERHVAYAAGLGRFGLNGGLITGMGINVRFGSIITNLYLEPTIRGKGSYMSSCLENQGGNCNECIKRCPVDAISNIGLDKEKCYSRKKAIEGRFMEEYKNSMKMFPHPLVKSGKRTEGYSLGCALCQVGVPCERAYPVMFLKGSNNA